MTKVYPYPEYNATVLQESQMFRVRVWDLTELPELPGTGTEVLQSVPRSSGYCGTGVQASQKFRAGTKHAVAVPRVL